MNPYHLPLHRQQDLASLKAQLRSELQRLEAMDAAKETPRSPNTLEEVEALEQKLRAALEELDTRKQQLSHRGQERSSKSESDDEQN